MKRFFLVIAVLWIHSIAASADCIVYSYDRPLLLELFLRSFTTRVRGCASLSVIYIASSDEYAAGYDTLKKEYPAVFFIRQSSQPASDFKRLTLDALNQSSTPYIIFAVDDIVIKDDVSLSDMADLLEKHCAYAFFLRLGTHITYCYSTSRDVPLPPTLMCVEPSLYSWTFSDGSGVWPNPYGDWAFPHTLDATLYRKATILPYFKTLNYTNPNNLEASWASYGFYHPVSSYKGLCYETTKIVNIPLNRIQQTYANRCMELYTTAELLDLFVKGFRIDDTPLYQIKNSAPHHEHYPTFWYKN